VLLLRSGFAILPSSLTLVNVLHYSLPPLPIPLPFLSCPPRTPQNRPPQQSPRRRVPVSSHRSSSPSSPPPSIPSPSRSAPSDRVSMPSASPC
jgi:hypothetical protein